MNDYLHNEDLVHAYLAGWEAPRYYMLCLQPKNIDLLPYCDLSVREKIEFTNHFARRGNLENVKYLHDLGFPIAANGFNNAIKSGNLKLVQWMNKQGYSFYSDSIRIAYSYGYEHIVKWMLSNKFDNFSVFTRKLRNLEDFEKNTHLDLNICKCVVKHSILELVPKCASTLPGTTLKYALKYNNIHVLKAVDLKRVDLFMVVKAAKYNNFGYFKKIFSLHKNDNYTDHYEKIYSNFARHGNLKAIKYVHKKFQFMHPRVSGDAFAYGHYKLVKYCLQYSELPVSFIKNSVKPNVEYFKLADEIGYQNFANLFLNTASPIHDHNISVIKWIKDNVIGEFNLMRYAAMNGHIDVLKWALDSNRLNMHDLNAHIRHVYDMGLGEIFEFLSSRFAYDRSNTNSTLDFNTDKIPLTWHFEYAIQRGMIKELEWCFRHECPLPNPMEIALDHNCGRSITFLLKKGYKIPETKICHPAIFISDENIHNDFIAVKVF